MRIPDGPQLNIDVDLVSGPGRDALIKRALCYSPRFGEIDFTVPMFDGFMKRWIPNLLIDSV